MPASSTTVHSILKSEESAIWSKAKINVLILAIEVNATNLFSFFVHHTHIVITIIFHFRSSTAHSHNWYLLLRRRSTFFKKFNQAKTPKIFNKSTRYFSKKNSLRCFVIYWLVISLLHTFKPFIHVHFDCYGKNYCKQHNGQLWQQQLRSVLWNHAYISTSSKFVLSEKCLFFLLGHCSPESNLVKNWMPEEPTTYSESPWHEDLKNDFDFTLASRVIF